DRKGAPLAPCDDLLGELVFDAVSSQERLDHALDRLLWQRPNGDAVGKGVAHGRYEAVQVLGAFGIGSRRGNQKKGGLRHLGRHSPKNVLAGIVEPLDVVDEEKAGGLQSTEANEELG